MEKSVEFIRRVDAGRSQRRLYGSRQAGLCGHHQPWRCVCALVPHTKNLTLRSTFTAWWLQYPELFTCLGHGSTNVTSCGVFDQAWCVLLLMLGSSGECSAERDSCTQPLSSAGGPLSILTDKELCDLVKRAFALITIPADTALHANHCKHRVVALTHLGLSVIGVIVTSI